ncbi:MAG TPA: hypothetical protein VLJ60_10365 [bacterium]|nr:hypothetical protein [bacterium]
MLDILRVFAFFSVFVLSGLILVQGEKMASSSDQVEAYYDFQEDLVVLVPVVEMPEILFADAEVTVPMSYVEMADLEINVVDERLAQNCSVEWDGSIQNEAACCV